MIKKAFMTTKTKKDPSGAAELKKLRARVRALERTEKRLARDLDALRESENIYRATFNNTGTITLIFDENTIITMVNSDFAKRMGYSKREVEGKLSWTEFVAPEDLARLKHYHELRSRDPKLAPRTHEFRIITRAGQMLNIFMTIEIIPGTRLRVASLIDITDRIRAEEAIMQISGAERQKIGQDLHDDLAPHLIGIEVLVKILADSLERTSQADAPLIAKIRTLLNEAISKTRRFAHGLCPVFLAEHGLESALKELSAATTDIYGVPCRFSFGEGVPKYDIDVSTHLYYIAQEAVHNAVKHGRATLIEIAVSAGGADTGLTVRDNGSGYDMSRHPDGIGHKIMQYRSRVIGAYLDIWSAIGTGTRVTVTLVSENGDKGSAIT